MCFCQSMLIATQAACNHGQTHRSAPTSSSKGAVPFKKNVLLPKHAYRNPSGITCGYATLDLLLHALAKGALLFLFNKKRSTPFHKEILPTFTKQLRKNYTIIPSIKGHTNISTFFIPAKLFKELFKKNLQTTFLGVSTQAVTLEMLCHE